MSTIINASRIQVVRNKQHLLSDISLTVEPGEITTIIGPNGAGKTTLLKVLLGIMPATSGQLTRARALKVGYVPQNLPLNRLLPLTVKRFMAMAPKPAISIEQALATTQVAHLSHFDLHTLSGGELQRVLIARALLREPQLLALDEPVQGVDINGQAALYQLISQLRDELGCAVLMVSHDLHWVMATTDHVICLNKHICCHGHPEKVSSDPAYLALFGQKIPEDLALYTHHHDHQHSIDGKVVDCKHD